MSLPSAVPQRPGSPRVDLRILDWVESGLVALTGPAEGPPAVPPGNAASRARELTSWIAAATGDTGHRVDLDGARLLGERAGLLGLTRAGRKAPGGGARLLRTADGWAAVSCARPDDASLIGALMGRRIHDDPWPALERWAASVPSAELDEGCALLGIAGGAVQARPPIGLPGTGPAPAARVDLSDLQGRSLAGALVVDFSALWAGPLCAHVLGLAGARVIKVEIPSRLDGARRGHSGFYNLLHSGHESVCLSPDEPSGRRLLSSLVERADIVIEASRPRALERFGVDAELAAGRGTAWISITARGRDVDRVGFGDDVAACAGLLAQDDAGQPVFVGDALADPLTGVTAAVHALSQQAAGRITDLPMYDVVRATLPGSDESQASVIGSPATGWFVAHGEQRIPVRTPAAPRTPPSGATAPEPGQDNRAVAHWLGHSGSRCRH